MTASFDHPDQPLPSGVAAGSFRGVTRTLIESDQAVLPELPLANGRRADLVAIDHVGKITIIEVKSSLADYRTDRKWRDYLDYCDVFYFAVTDDFPKDVLPKDEGLMIADAFAADILRPGQYRPISAARRKAMLIRFARLAAGRFQTLFGMLS
jgi:hypothetical protein